MYNKPGAICLEPLHGNKAAILTLLIHLPSGEGQFAPNGQSGFALGSSMVTFGGEYSDKVTFVLHSNPLMC